ncbi:MAG: hypothetical protein HYZ17_04760 [Betaproteobacteria bacterium]|nr:hypothetical protein [Betaproteobacteria bacterium]
MAIAGVLKRLSAVAVFLASAGLALPPVALAQEAVRPEIGKPLKAAGDLLKAGKHKDALTKIREADAVANKTANESYLLERMRGSAAAGAGDSATAIRSFEAVMASGKVPSGEQSNIAQTLAILYYNGRDFGNAIKWASRYLKEGGGNPQVRTVLIQSYFQSGDFANTAKEALADVQADEKAGRTPSEEKLQLLANAYLRQKNNGGYVASIEKLLNYYPKKSLWANIISHLQRKPGFSDRLSLDVFRLQLATGNLTSTSDFMEMAQLALQAGFPAEAKKIVDEGYTSGALGKGADIERQKRLRDLVDKRAAENKKLLDSGSEIENAKAAKEGNALVSLGYNFVTAGQVAKGIALMEEGIKKGGLKRPNDAKLWLGVALIQTGAKPKGVGILKGVQGQDGVQDLANLWTIFAR